MLGFPHYGCQGVVLQSGTSVHGRVQLEFLESISPDLRPVMRLHDKVAVRYMPGYRIAQMVSLSPHIVSRIAGSVLVNKSAKETDPDRQARVNIGLNLKVTQRTVR